MLIMCNLDQLKDKSELEVISRTLTTSYLTSGSLYKRKTVL